MDPFSCAAQLRQLQRVGAAAERQVSCHVIGAGDGICTLHA